MVEVAWINDACIGCAKCLNVCPVDAIVGSEKWQHAVLLEECTGCKWCLPVCPVQCIELRPMNQLIIPTERAQHLKKRVLARKTRLHQESTLKAEKDKAVANQMTDILSQILARTGTVK